MRVLMVDDHVLFLQGMRALLSLLAPDLDVHTARDRHEALQCVLANNYEVLLLDWNLVGCKGDELIASLRDAGCTARVVVVSGETDPVRISDMLAHGVSGFIPKTYTGERMLAALETTLQGRVFVPDEISSHMWRSEDAGPPQTARQLRELVHSLTPRQLDVFRNTARGLPNKLIARELNISEATVKTHLTAVFGALGVSNRTEAALLASRIGFHVG